MGSSRTENPFELPKQPTIEVAKEDIRAVETSGEFVPAANLTVPLPAEDIVEIKPGSAVDLDAKVEVTDDELVPKPPILPDVSKEVQHALEVSAPTEIVERLPAPPAPSAGYHGRGRVLVIGIYFLATLAVGIAMITRC